MRLNRFLASAGLGSRRSCEELIRSGQVTINGVMCETLATNVEPTDVVKVGQRVLHSAAPMTLLINKPVGFLCTASDTHDRRTVFDLLPANFPRLFHVGRLDMESEGLLLLTNDGELSLKLTHPRYKVSKEYEVVLDHAFDFELAEKLLHGMSLEEGWAKAEAVHKLAANKVKVVLRQGLKRQIRRMFYVLGYEVKKLVRTRIGPLAIGSMEPGAWRVLAQKEIDALLAEGQKNAAEAPSSPRPRKPRPAAGDRRPFSPRSEGTKRPRRPLGSKNASRPERESREEQRPRTPARPGAPRPGYGKHGKLEEIPFVPRAHRGESTPGERPGFGSKPPHKPWLKKKNTKAAAQTPKPSSKPAPRPFAKFQKRRFD